MERLMKDSAADPEFQSNGFRNQNRMAFLQAIIQVHYDTRLSWGAKALFNFLFQETVFADDVVRLTLNFMAQEHNVTIRTVQRWVQELSDVGLLTVMPTDTSRGMPNEYQIPCLKLVYGELATWSQSKFKRWRAQQYAQHGWTTYERLFASLRPHDKNAELFDDNCVIKPHDKSVAKGGDKNVALIRDSLEQDSKSQDLYLSEANKSPSDVPKSEGGIAVDSQSNPKLGTEESGIPDSQPLEIGMKHQDNTARPAHPMAAFARRREEATDLVAGAKASAKAQREAEKLARRESKQQEKAERMQDLMEGRVTSPPPGLTGVDLEEWRRKPGRIYEHFRVAMMKAGHDVAPAGSMAVLGMVSHYVGQFEKVDQAIDVLTWSIKNWATVRQKETWIKDDLPTWNILSSDNVLPKLRNMAKSTPTSRNSLVIGGSR